MQSRLLMFSTAFHAFNLASLIVVARLWRHRYSEEPRIRPRPGQIGTDLFVLGLLASLSAVVFGVAASDETAGVLALGSQWLFAELLLLLAMAASYGFRLSPEVRRPMASTSPRASAGIAWPALKSSVRGSTLRP